MESQEPFPITGLEIKNRKYECEAYPVIFLDDESRIERYGLKFLVTICGSKTVKIHLNVKIKPENKEKSPPYVVVYVANQKTGPDEELTYKHLDQPKNYLLTKYDTYDWYRIWLNRALNRSGGKIFMKDMWIE